MLRMAELRGHKLLNFLLLKIVKNVSTCRPQLGNPPTNGLCLRFVSLLEIEPRGSLSSKAFLAFLV